MPVSITYKFNKLLLFVTASLLLLASQWACAGIDAQEQKIAGPFANNVSVTTTDDKFENPAVTWANVVNRSVKNTISLRVKDSLLITYSFTYTVNLKIEYYTTPYGPIQGTINTTLSVGYAPGQGVTYKGLDVASFQNAFKVKCTVLSTSGLPPAAGVVELVNRIEIDRTYTFQPTAGLSITGSIANNHLQLGWATVQGAEEYDVEWTTINNGNPKYTVINAGYTGSSTPGDTAIFNSLAKSFRNNSSRVTVEASTYSISLASTDNLILVRIRQAQYNTAGIRVTGNWDYKKGTSYAVWPIAWNESKLNWQYSAAYAEEGKKKEVISYFDGTLRGRQTVTINNSDNVLVAQENIYDEFGRVTASIMPAPTKPVVAGTPVLAYIKSFNVTKIGTNNYKPYNYLNVIGSGGVSCELKPDSLSPDYGAYKYYSPANDFTDKAYIPHAQGFPLSVTQYTSDNTGRIKIQGGVGRAYQPGSADSRVTRYYYGKPEQWELDQLFGNDAGFAEHYLKNMVVDPNGQVSISYLNASGKTIATALTGRKPDNLDSLASYKPIDSIPKRITHVLTPDRFVYNSSALKLSATTTYLASVTGNNMLKFSLKKMVTTYPGAFKLCSNCSYNMSVKVTNDCGALINSKSAVVGSITANPADTTMYRDSIPVVVDRIGEYNISIEFAFDNAVIEGYTDVFIKKGIDSNYIEKQFDYIKKRYLDSLDVSGCYADCHTCNTLLGVQANFVQMLRDKFTALEVDPVSVNSTAFTNWANALYTTLKTKCTNAQAACQYSPCSSIQSLLEMDISPGGQYALFKDDGTPIEPEINVLTLVASGTTTPNWRVKFPVLDPSNATYQSEAITLEDGTIISPHDASFTIQQLITYWKPEWATRFLVYHPEYCKLQYCMENTGTFKSWDMFLQEQVNTAADISFITPATAGYVTSRNANNTDWLLSVDPFFQSTLGSGYYAQMHNDLLSYSTNALKITDSRYTPKTLFQYVDYVLYCQNTAGTTFTQTNAINSNDSWNFCTPNASCRVADREWALYRDYYIELKEKIYDALAKAQCGGNCSVGQKITVPLPGACAVYTDFTLKPHIVATCSGSQTFALTREVGAVSQTTTVTLYYPPIFDSLNPTKTFVFSAGESQKVFCVPNEIPLLAVRIQKVVCANGETTETVDNGGNPTTYKVVTVDAPDFSTPQNANTCGASVWSPRSFYVVLQDASGNPVNSLNPITVTYTFSFQPTAGGSWTSVNNTAVINTGSSTSSKFYYVASNNGTCRNYVQSAVTCIVSVSGGSLKLSGQSIGKCGGYIETPYTPPPSTCPAVYAYKTSRFPDISDYGAQLASKDGATLSADGLAAIKAQAKDLCTGSADTWMERLKPALDSLGVLQGTRDNLRTALINVCAAGGDINHPFGASSTPTIIALVDTTFGAAIKQVLSSYLPGGKFLPTLNPWLIDSPYPFNPQQQSTVKVISATTQPLCDILAALTVKAGSAANLYNYLVTTYQSAMTLTSAEVTMLQSSCSNCKFLLAQDLALPVFLDPGNKGVITGLTYCRAVDEMNGYFAGAIDSTKANYQTIIANFMNFKFGFSLTYDDYATFGKTACASPLSILCNTLPYKPVKADPYDCVKNMMTIAVNTGKADYDNYIAAQRRLFRNNYINTCKAAQANADFIAKDQIYHYTLYYYDQADNLVRTIPPDGVTLIDSTRFAAIDAARIRDTTTSYIYNGPADNYTTGAFLKLSEVLSAAQGAVELWLYNTGTATKHLVEFTPDIKYIFQVSVAGTTLAVDVFKLNQTVATSVSFTPISGHYTADISTMLPLSPFSHVVFQGDSLGKGTRLPELYFNGTKLTVSTGASVPSPYGFSVTAGASAITFPDSTHALKHMILYKHKLSAANIKADAANTNFYIADAVREGWYRFNTPAAGSATTTGPGSKDETSLFFQYNAHVLPTTYVYNSTNQVTLQNSPDGGTNRFWYDMLSRLSISQNDKQYGTDAAKLNNYSYTTYDVLGRITEVGQKNQTALNLGTPRFLPADTLTTFKNAGTNTQITNTYYDAPASTGINGIAILNGLQKNLRKRVAASTYTQTQGATVLNATYYNYDIGGNVKTLWQQIAGLNVQGTNIGIKRIDYEYDLVSEKVNFVLYQNGQPDQFYYSYEYDSDNRLTKAWTGLKAIVNQNQGSYLLMDQRRLDASYSYYLHGPLRRMELGDVYSKVQGVDYAYTLQGWLKGTNSTAVTSTTDMGGDGGTAHPTIAKDAYGYNLYYNNTDYKPITGTVVPFATTMQTTSGFLRELFNGNIAGSSINIPQLSVSGWLDRKYEYDQLNRLTHLTTFHTASMASAPVNSHDYEETFSYDGNGNIQTLNRSGSNAATTDVIGYKYNRDANNKLIDNRLNYLSGTAAASGITPNQTANNYTYDALGNLIGDIQAGISAINWTVYGKIDSITKAVPLKYRYDIGGNRVSKKVSALTTYYVRDVQGNPLAVYDNQGGNINWREQHLYGSSRLGIWTPNTNTANFADASNAWDTVGRRQYELNNHLGNVLVTISDKRLQHTSNSTTVDYFAPDVANAQDYYAFGSLQPGRQYSAGVGYRYGFNGKENDNDVGKGAGNQQDYGMRIYDPRVGRFLSVDPLTKSYPWYTPYSFAGNKPITFIDRDGEEEDPGVYAAGQRNIREYERQLRKEDPEHAEDIIMQHNVNAFLFVGGALTGGSGKMATIFWDFIMGAGTARTTQGIINHNQRQTNQGLHLMFNAAVGEIVGASISYFSGVFKTSVKYLFRGTTEGWEGSRGLQQSGFTPTSSDPAVATIFAINSKEHGNAILEIVLPQNLQGVSFEVNTLSKMENEIGIGLLPAELTKRVSVTITADEARGILTNMGIKIPAKIKLGSLSDVIKETPKLNESQINQFYKEAVKLSAKSK